MSRENRVGNDLSLLSQLICRELLWKLDEASPHQLNALCTALVKLRFVDARILFHCAKKVESDFTPDPDDASAVESNASKEFIAAAENSVTDTDSSNADSVSNSDNGSSNSTQVSLPSAAWEMRQIACLLYSYAKIDCMYLISHHTTEAYSLLLNTVLIRSIEKLTAVDISHICFAIGRRKETFSNSNSSVDGGETLSDIS